MLFFLHYNIKSIEEVWRNLNTYLPLWFYSWYIRFEPWTEEFCLLHKCFFSFPLLVHLSSLLRLNCEKETFPVCCKWNQKTSLRSFLRLFCRISRARTTLTRSLQQFYETLFESCSNFPLLLHQYLNVSWRLMRLEILPFYWRIRPILDVVVPEWFGASLQAGPTATVSGATL